MTYLTNLNSSIPVQISLWIGVFIKIVIDVCAPKRNNTERSLCPSACSPMVIYWEMLKQCHRQSAALIQLTSLTQRSPVLLESIMWLCMMRVMRVWVHISVGKPHVYVSQSMCGDQKTTPDVHPHISSWLRQSLCRYLLHTPDHQPESSHNSVPCTDLRVCHTIKV